MSGHSHWKQIQHKKGAADKKRGQLFSKLLKAVSIAAKENPDPEFNAKLRSTIDKAKSANVPNENIERAIKKSNEEKDLQAIIIEAYGPEKSAIIIEGITDNTNRAINEIRTLLNNSYAKMATPGSVLWAFDAPTGDKTEWSPKFPQTISVEAKKKLEILIAKLDEHDDVQKVTTNVK